MRLTKNVRELNESSVILNKWASTLKELVYGSIILCATTKTRIKNNMKKFHATSCLPSSTETFTIDFTRILCCWFPPKRWKEENKGGNIFANHHIVRRRCQAWKYWIFYRRKYIFSTFFMQVHSSQSSASLQMIIFPNPMKFFLKYGSEVRSNKFIKTTTGSFEREASTPLPPSSHSFFLPSLFRSNFFKSFNYTKRELKGLVRCKTWSNYDT